MAASNDTSNVRSTYALSALSQIELRDLFTASLPQQTLLTHLISSAALRKRLEAHAILKDAKVVTTLEDVIYQPVIAEGDQYERLELRLIPMYIGLTVADYQMSGDREILSDDAAERVLDVLMIDIERRIFNDIIHHPYMTEHESVDMKSNGGYAPSPIPLIEDAFKTLMFHMPRAFRLRTKYYMNDYTGRHIPEPAVENYEVEGDIKDVELDPEAIPDRLLGKPVVITPYLPSSDQVNVLPVVAADISRAHLYGLKLDASYIFLPDQMLFVVEILCNGQLIVPSAVRAIKTIS